MTDCLKSIIHMQLMNGDQSLEKFHVFNCAI